MIRIAKYKRMPDKTVYHMQFKHHSPPNYPVSQNLLSYQNEVKTKNSNILALSSFPVL